jgi:DAK2 domain fusion protein YloV
VKRTPELLPILKQAGVVDSGGIGLFFIIEGMLRYINDQPVDIAEKSTTIPTSIKLSEITTHQIQESIEPGQDFEVVVDFNPHNPINITAFYNELQRIGTSVQLGEGDNMYRMHIHVPADKKYDPIEFIMKHGTVTKVYIENLMEQMKSQKAPIMNQRKTQIQKGQVAIVAVSPGEGISQIFQSLGVAAIISGGQTMNPSTQEILDSYNNLPTDKVIILPNNKNIILAAESASKMSDKKVTVIQSKSIPQGLAAALCYTPEVKMEDVVVNINKALSEVDTGEITTAIRSIEINGVKVKKGEVIALLNGDLIGSSDNLGNACLMLLQKINFSEKEHLTIFYGKNIKKSEVGEVAKLIKTKFPEIEIETHYGGQPHYQFILSIE